MTSPTFVATFADGLTRMTTHCSEAKLDLMRGIRLARIAYESRMKQEPPALIAGHFEKPGGGLIKAYTEKDLKEKTS